MEQHMYTFLNQKYGLKKLTYEWAAAMVDAVTTYAANDNSVAVFHSILKNC
jgi:hypothetical protein